MILVLQNRILSRAHPSLSQLNVDTARCGEHDPDPFYFANNGILSP